MMASRKYAIETKLTNVAIIGSGPTGIYTLKGLIASDTPLSIIKLKS